MTSNRAVVFNHFGHCVTDLRRAVRFYTELFGFEEQRRIKVPDAPDDRMLRIEAPLGASAVYLVRDAVVLELLHFDRKGNPPFRPRALNEPGLTHMSFCVPDVGQAAEGAEALGGEALPDTDIGHGMFIRDPDGQLIELLPMSYRAAIESDSAAADSAQT